MAISGVNHTNHIHCPGSRPGDTARLERYLHPLWRFQFSDIKYSNTRKPTWLSSEFWTNCPFPSLLLWSIWWNGCKHLAIEKYSSLTFPQFPDRIYTHSDSHRQNEPSEGSVHPFLSSTIGSESLLKGEPVRDRYELLLTILLNRKHLYLSKMARDDKAGVLCVVRECFYRIANSKCTSTRQFQERSLWYVSEPIKIDRCCVYTPLLVLW